LPGGGDTNVAERAVPGWVGGLGTPGDDDTVYVTPSMFPLTAGHETVTLVSDKTAVGTGIARTLTRLVTDGPTKAAVLEGVRVN
jgi:hypothetical protein